MLAQHGSNLKALGKGKNLIDRAKILKKVIALVLVLQRKNCFEKLVNSFCVYFLVHDIVPPVLHLSKVCGNFNVLQTVLYSGRIYVFSRKKQDRYCNTLKF